MLGQVEGRDQVGSIDLTNVDRGTHLDFTGKLRLNRKGFSERGGRGRGCSCLVAVPECRWGIPIHGPVILIAPHVNQRSFLSSSESSHTKTTLCALGRNLSRCFEACTLETRAPPRGCFDSRCKLWLDRYRHRHQSSGCPNQRVLTRLAAISRFEKSLYDLIKGLRNHKGAEDEYIQNALRECKAEVKSQDMGRRHRVPPPRPPRPSILN